MQAAQERVSYKLLAEKTELHISSVWRGWNDPARPISVKFAQKVATAAEELGYEVPPHIRSRAAEASE